MLTFTGLFKIDNLDPKRIEHLLEEAKLEGISLDLTSLEFSFRKALERLATTVC